MSDGTLYGWFADSAARYGEAVALEAEGVNLTYRQLDRLTGTS